MPGKRLSTYWSGRRSATQDVRCRSPQGRLVDHTRPSPFSVTWAGHRDQPAVQERICGLAPLLPFIIVVKPKVLPLPLDRIVIT